LSAAARLLRALPTMARVGFADAVAYRAEMLVWILSTTMPLVMMPLWLAVARQRPVGGVMDERHVVAYFLATFLVRQLTAAWVAWQIGFEIKQGTLSIRLLRPVSPVLAYMVEHLSALPVRIVIAFPIAATLLVREASDRLPDSARAWVMAMASIVGAWLITFSVQLTLGALSFWLESSTKLVDVWFAGYLVSSGYLIPLSAMPPALGAINDWLPFRYQIGLPVELSTSAHDADRAAELLTRQWCWVTLALGIALLTWKRGVRRFEAYGG
jgi:ABC-2 type transport system permease protein